MENYEAPGFARAAAHTAVGEELSLLSDRALGEMVAAAPELGSGIGGRRAETEVAGVRVFVKRVPLTDVELSSEHVRSTANLFELPLYYQYGVGSAGFGAWRELAAHLTTTDWVLSGEHTGFPLMYHWRVLPDRAPDGFVDEFGGIEGAVAHWEGSSAVRRRLEAIGRSSSSLVLFLEHIPRTLGAWLRAARDGTVTEPDLDASYVWVEDALLRGTEFMSSRGLVHFDTHFANVLTDGRRSTSRISASLSAAASTSRGRRPPFSPTTSCTTAPTPPATCCATTCPKQWVVGRSSGPSSGTGSPDAARPVYPRGSARSSNAMPRRPWCSTSFTVNW